MSEKLLLSSDDLISPPGAKAAIGSVYVPLALRGRVCSNHSIADRPPVEY